MNGEQQTSVTLSDQQVSAMLAVEPFACNSDYAGLSIPATLSYMHVMYVDAFSRRMDISCATLCDCAAGLGWLSFAFLLAGGGRAVLVEPDERKVVMAREFARILGVADRCEFRVQKMHEIDLPDQSIDIFASVETLEHVGKAHIRASVENITRLTRRIVLLTAPNQLSPLVSHDARVPFSHWLPLAWRGPFCRLFGRRFSHFNHFPGPWHLAPLRQRFNAETHVLVFDSYRDWRDHYPVYSPYNGGFWKEAPALWLRLYLRAISMLLGRRAYWVSPNLAAVWVAGEAEAEA
jgi:hypothetical protein